MLSYEDIILKIKSDSENTLQMIFHVETAIDEKKKIAEHFKNQFEKPSLTTYLEHAGHMCLDCFYINQKFIRRLAEATNRLAFTEYNNLFTLGTGSRILFGTHHLVQLEQDNYFIAVDVAAEQYLDDNKTVAEITIASSYEKLMALLTTRFGLQAREDGIETWMKNQERRNEVLVAMLKSKPIVAPRLSEESSGNQLLFTPVVFGNSKSEKTLSEKTLVVVKPSGSGIKCCIL